MARAKLCLVRYLAKNDADLASIVGSCSLAARLTPGLLTMTSRLYSTALVSISAIAPKNGGLGTDLPALGQHPVERVDVEVRRLDINTQRRLGLQDVHVVTGGLDDHPELEHAVADRRRLLGRGLQSL